MTRFWLFLISTLFLSASLIAGNKSGNWSDLKSLVGKEVILYTGSEKDNLGVHLDLVNYVRIKEVSDSSLTYSESFFTEQAPRNSVHKVTQKRSSVKIFLSMFTFSQEKLIYLRSGHGR